MTHSPLTRALALVALVCTPAFAAYELPETLWVKVTFYDFHADGSNPNFEACNCGRKPGMVQDTLDSTHKPLLSADLCCNARIAEWFRPSGGTGATFGYDATARRWGWTGLVPYKGRVGEFVGASYDSAYDMANVVIYDSLPFTIYDPATGTYEFVRNKNLNNHEQFFWLDERGFGIEPADKFHNYSFTMELHHEFTYQGGEFFNFYGDDDAWVFINGQLVLDLGGMQSEVHGSVSLDQLAAQLGLRKGRKYMFDFFYTERRTTQSNIVITTNILTPAKPQYLVVSTDSIPPDSIGAGGGGISDTTVSAGDCITWYAHVVDDTGAVRPDWARNVVWEVRDSLGNPLNYALRSDTNTFCLQEAYGCVTVYLSYQDTLFPEIVLYDTVQICVKPGPADHIVIEASPDSFVSLRSDNPLALMAFSSTETQQLAYAVLRDRFGNFVANGSGATWRSLDSAVVTARQGPQLMLGEGIVQRVATSGLTQVVTRLGLMSDTVNVMLDNITYDSLRIVAGTSLRDIDTLRIRTDQDTTLLALGLRSDNGQWDNVFVRWTPVGLAFQSAAPAWSTQWQDLAPATAGTGRIIISRISAAGTRADTLVVIASNGLPRTLVLYPSPGAPNTITNPSYPSSALTSTVNAGTPFPAVAKLFDGRGVWLSNYELATAPFSWRIAEVSGVPPSGALSPLSGYQTAFNPMRAGNTVLLIAEFQYEGAVLADSVRLTVRPGPADHLVIEPVPDRDVSPYSDNELSRLVFAGYDTVQRAYAILRDEFGNYVSVSQRTTWTAVDTTIAQVTLGQTTLGEGVVRRRANVGVTLVIARNEDDTTLLDTVPVELTNITYDSLRIVVNNLGLKDITNLTIRTDQDTTLIALGLRSDTRQWESIRANWSAIGLRASPQAPSGAQSWSFSPDTAGSGLIVASYGPKADTVQALFLHGLPRALVLYPAAGTPNTGGNQPLPPPSVIDTVAAGTQLTCAAKLFSADGAWLSSYESALAPITWRVVEAAANTDAPTGTLSTTTGAISGYRPTVAFNTVDVIATFTEGTVTLTDTIRLHVTAAPAHRLVIESSADWRTSPHRPNPVDTIVIGAADTMASGYALLRDMFGNFSGYASAADWTTLSPGIVTAGRGISSVGEGRIFRIADAGVGLVAAVSPAGLADSVAVLIGMIRYDSLRIVTTDARPIDRISTNTGNDTTLMVQGKRSDNGRWELVRADWAVLGNVNVSPAAPRQAESWTFVPMDTGTGWIVTSIGTGAGRISDTIVALFGSGAASSLVLYPREGAPDADNRPYPAPATPVTVVAGRRIDIVAKLFDRNSVWLSELETSNTPIAWKLIEEPGSYLSGTISDSSGHKTSFLGTKAYRNVYVVATYSAGSIVFADTMRITIVAGPGHHLVIEANQNREISPNADNPIASVTLTSLEKYRRVYAIVRDSLGNWVDYSLVTLWTSRDTGVVSARAGITDIGEGVITRVDTGITHVVAQNAETRYGGRIMIDSVRVNASDFFYHRLRIVNAAGIALDSLAMTTNDDTLLMVQGLRSDDSTWEFVQAEWEVDSSLAATLSPPQLDGQWRVSPKQPSSGYVRVTLGIDSVTTPDTLPAVFLRGRPTSAQFEMLTPEAMRIAGDTLVAVVRIYNRDGLVPGTFCFAPDSATGGASYWDPLGSGGPTRPDPFMIVDGDSTALRASAAAAPEGTQCFENGSDTVRIVLFYAPANPDSAHRITGMLGSLPVSSIPFTVRPAGLASMVLEYPDLKPVGDTVTLRHPDGAAVIVAVGFDRFGNRRGPETSDWAVDGTLHPLRRPDDVSRVYIQAIEATENESGLLTAVAMHGTDTISARTFLRIIGPLIQLTRAVTRDLNANGYLDAIELHFVRPVTLGSDFSFGNLQIVCNGDTFTLDSIAGTGRSDSAWLLVLDEDTSGSALQTRWQPRIWFDQFDDVAGASALLCVDGAGPVIRSVTRISENIDDRTKDRIRVVLSEPVRGADGNSLKVSVAPELLFNVWQTDESGSFRLLPDMLKDIANLQEVTRDSIVEFYMTNGNDVGARHYFNLASDSIAIVDRSTLENGPREGNRRVRVVVEEGPARKEVAVFPNPSPPTFRREPAGMFEAEHRPEARRWASIDRAGSVVTFKVKIPETGKVRVAAKIYDAVGNLVTSASNPDLTSQLPTGMTSYDIDLYWNGSNRQGMKVAPGVYRVVIYVDYASGTYPDMKIAGKIGIGR